MNKYIIVVILDLKYLGILGFRENSILRILSIYNKIFFLLQTMPEVHFILLVFFCYILMHLKLYDHKSSRRVQRSLSKDIV